MAGEVYSPRGAEVETALVAARELSTWWTAVEAGILAGTSKVDSFELFPASPEAGLKPTIGFFADADLAGRKVAVMGHVLDAFYSRPMVPKDQRADAAIRIRHQVEEFALRYWLRNQVDVLPEPIPEPGRAPLPPYLQVVSWVPPPGFDLDGVNNLQRRYKRMTGETGCFSPDEAARIVDLRTLGREYEWVQLDRQILAFDLTLSAGEELSVVLPLKRRVPVAMDARLVVNRTGGTPGVLGCYGPGFARVRCPGGVFSFGPDDGQPGFETQYLQVLESGEVRVRAISIVAAPAKLFDISWNPAQWSLGMMDMMTMGATRGLTRPFRETLGLLPSLPLDPFLAPVEMLNRFSGNTIAETLCLTKRDLLTGVLAQEAARSLNTLLATRQIWQTGPDWLRPESLPPWVEAGGPPQPPVLRRPAAAAR